MKKAWRLVKGKRAADAFSGEGARLAGGRWNLPGTAVVYLSEHLSLAVLELFVHLPNAARHIAFASFEVTIPTDIAVKVLPAEDLPAVWREEPPPEEIQRIGTDWAQKGETLLLSVPSAIVPNERNVLVNPDHPDFKRISVSSEQAFSFDPRMWK